ncbi:MAG: hypothetical protein H6509_00085 [Bryobacterales bacterium]|nr:hypothetical protein [Bryobacterales bacterium]
MKILDALGAGFKETLAFFPRLLSILHQLWNEIIGFLFFALALFFMFNANGVVESFNGLEQDPDAAVKLALAGFVAAMCFYFGWSSFRRAKKIQRTNAANN